MKILVIDDEEDLRAMIAAALEDSGYEVETAEDGNQGIAKLKDGDYDLVITDIFMPDKDGIEVVTTIQEIKAHRPMTVFAMSGGGKFGLDMLGLTPGLGADKIFRKPFDLRELLQAIRDICQ